MLDIPNRRYIVSAVTGITVAGTVAALSAIAGSQPGAYRMGIKNEAGEVPLATDFRTLAIGAGLAVNFLPMAADMLGGVPVVGGVLRTVDGFMSPQVQDWAALLGMTGAISLASTEALDAVETGEFLGLPLPGPVLALIGGGSAPETMVDEGGFEEDVALAS